MPCRPTYDTDCRTNDKCDATCLLQSNGVTTCVTHSLNCTAKVQYCVPTVPACVDCLSNIECTNGKNCSTTFYTCTQDCNTDDDCNTNGGINTLCGSTCSPYQQCLTAGAVTCAAPYPYCEYVGPLGNLHLYGSYECRQCRTSTDCPTGQFCDEFYTCVSKCQSAADCRSDTACAGVECIAGACITTSATGCSGTSPKCLTATGSCVNCLQNSDCPAGGTCDVYQCAVCLDDYQCRTSTNCNSKCNSNAQCSTPTGQQPLVCPSGQTCDPYTATCVQCNSDSDCNSDTNCGLVCNYPSTCAGTGVSCTATSEHCASYNNGNYQCYQCATDYDCPGTQICVNGDCSVTLQNITKPPQSTGSTSKSGAGRIHGFGMLGVVLLLLIKCLV